MKIVVSVLLFLSGFVALLMWESGSHGHLQFRPKMAEDWIICAVLMMCFGLSIFYFSIW
jgi:hypothetical protein